MLSNISIQIHPPVTACIKDKMNVQTFTTRSFDSLTIVIRHLLDGRQLIRYAPKI